MDKSLLIVSDNPAGELASALERALKFLADGKYKINKMSYEFKWERPPKSPDVLLILDDNPQDSSYTAGIHFLRNLWKNLIEKGELSPPIILLSFNSLKDLVRKDHRSIVTCAENISLITMPFALKDIKEEIELVADKKIDSEAQKQFLKWSCGIDVGTTSEHAIKNFFGPYSLLMGAYYSGELPRDTLLNLLKKFQERVSSEELNIRYAVTKPKIDYGFPKKELNGNELFSILKDRHVLLMDDEYKSADWEQTFQTLFGEGCRLKAIGKELIDMESGEIKKGELEKILISSDGYFLNYDLILLDLYLIAGENEKIDGTKEAYKFSGVRLLKEIRKKDPTVPVILFTATNKAFNIEAAEVIEIDGQKVKGIDYNFPKEIRYHNEEEAKPYFARFRELIEKCICQERMAIREIWKGIKILERMDIEHKDEVLRFLKSALSALRGYFFAKEESYIVGTLVMLGDVVERLKNRDLKKKENLHIYSPLGMVNKLAIKDARKKPLLALYEKDIYFFLINQLRNSSAHGQAEITFEDAIIAFFAILKALNVNIHFKWNNCCDKWKLTANEAEKMVNLICKHACSSSCQYESGKDKIIECKKDQTTPLKKAMFLSMENNLKKSQEALSNQVFFKYMLYQLHLSEIKKDVDKDILPLITYRLTGGGLFCPPFKDGYWVGIEQADGSINSPLGNLKAKMVKDKKQEGDKVLFHLTKEYLRGK